MRSRASLAGTFRPPHVSVTLAISRPAQRPTPNERAVYRTAPEVDLLDDLAPAPDAIDLDLDAAVSRNKQRGHDLDRGVGAVLQ